MECFFYILNPIKRVEHWMKVREAALHADANDQQNIEVLSKKHEGSAFFSLDKVFFWSPNNPDFLKIEKVIVMFNGYV